MDNLISGSDAKLAWAKGEALQIRETGTTEWLPLADTYTLMVFDYERYEIRKKPRTIKLDGVYSKDDLLKLISDEFS